MSIRMILAASVALALAAPAFAQTGPIPPPAPGGVASDPAQEASAALAEATTRAETAGRALEAAFAELTPQLAEVRADALTPEAVRTTRVLNLVAARQLEVDALADAIYDLLLEQSLAQGMAREEAETLAASVRGRVSTSIIAGFSGRGLEGDDD